MLPLLPFQSERVTLGPNVASLTSVGESVRDQIEREIPRRRACDAAAGKLQPSHAGQIPRLHRTLELGHVVDPPAEEAVAAVDLVIEPQDVFAYRVVVGQLRGEIVLLLPETFGRLYSEKIFETSSNTDCCAGDSAFRSILLPGNGWPVAGL